MSVKHLVDKNKRINVCLISVKKKKTNGKSFTYQFKGKAKCSPEDTFDELFGKNMAHVRALIKFKNWEKVGHQATIDFCNKAIEYYTKQAEKYTKYLAKTNSAIDRLNKELSDMLN